jgi:hypothetical protein
MMHLSVLGMVVGLLASNVHSTPTSDLKIIWTGSKGAAQQSLPMPAQLKSVSSLERDPLSGNTLQWKGVLLSEFVEKAIDTLAADDKAQVDLIVAKNSKGDEVLIPRAFVVRYPIILGSAPGKSTTIVVPWTSKPKIVEEALPLETFFISDVSQIELANYKARFGTYFLKKRTDPVAIRGEKLFVQTCFACHSNSQQHLETKAKTIASSEHPSVKGNVKLNDKNRRSLISYLDAYSKEN